eukprot:12499757-Prorocentrum_lima.AAC.1
MANGMMFLTPKYPDKVEVAPPKLVVQQPMGSSSSSGLRGKNTAPQTAPGPKQTKVSSMPFLTVESAN